MWKLLTFIGSVIKTFFWLALVLALAAVAFLYVLERDMPASFVRRISAKISSDDYLVRIGRATYSLKSGLHLYHVKAFPKRVADNALVSADEITIDLALQLKLSKHERIRGITIKNICLPTLPPKSKEKRPGQEKPKPPQPVKIPDMAPFPLTLETVDILGIKAKKLTAAVDLDTNRIAVTEVRIQWPDQAFAMEVAGYVTADFNKRLVNGNAKGQAFPENILPLLNELHSRAAIRQIGCFSKIERPVNAEATFNVNMDNSDFSLFLDLDVGPCAYRGVPMKFAKGTLEATGTNIYTSVFVGPLQAESSTGPIAGRLAYREETDSLELDTTAAMGQDQLFTVINILNHGELKPLRCDTPPRISAKGVIALDSASITTNALFGQLAFGKGSIFSIPVTDMTGDFSIKGYSALFENISGTSASGGKITGDIEFLFPNYAATSTVFTTHVSVADTDLADLSRALNVTNTRAGWVSGTLKLSGRASNRTLASLSGDGKFRIRDGLIHRMRLFAGFTDYLARTIPGISSLVNQSSASMDFTIKDGILRTENLLVEGDIFSIQGKGSCNLETGALDFIVRANIFKQKTIAGRITHLITLPFTRLLLEFKLFGTLDNPEWSYANILERITESLSGTPDTPSPSLTPQHPAEMAKP